MRIGLISDTHGQLRNEIFDLLAGVDQILHAGDIGGPDLLVELSAIAPVLAVYGNTDGFDIRGHVPDVVEWEAAGRRIVVTHGHQFGAPNPGVLARAFPRADIIVFGHTHRPVTERIANTLVINPGAAGPPRFGLRPSIAELRLEETGPDVRLIEL